jgi:hypothetical protein
MGVTTMVITSRDLETPLCAEEIIDPLFAGEAWTSGLERAIGFAPVGLESGSGHWHYPLDRLSNSPAYALPTLEGGREE